MSPSEGLRVFSSGATELWADGVRTGHKLGSLGKAALETERPLHVAAAGADVTLCGMPLKDLHEYPVDFAVQEQRIRCPRCDDELENGLGRPDPH
jgi:hypothetical protein